MTGVHRTDQRPPQEAQAIVESLKRYLPDATSRIRLRELVRDVVEDRIVSLSADTLLLDVADSNEALVTRVEKLYSMSEAPMMLAINGCYWGEPHHDDVWLALIRRLAEVEAPSGGSRGLTSLFHLPATSCSVRRRHGCHSRATIRLAQVDTSDAHLFDSPQRAKRSGHFDIPPRHTSRVGRTRSLSSPRCP